MFAESYEPFQPASTDADLLPVVDENDIQTGVLPRREVHLRQLRHRAVHICVIDPIGRLWLQLRSRAKDTWAGNWDLSATGHVDPGESYESAARRELVEELGLHGEPIYLTKLEASAWRGWEFHALYYLRHDGPIEHFNQNEIEQLRPFTRAEIDRIVQEEDTEFPLCPGVIDALPWLTAETSFGMGGE